MEKDEEESYDSADHHGNRLAAGEPVEESYRLKTGRWERNMNDVEQLLEELIRKLPETRSYNQYHTLLRRVKEQPELYQRIGDFRRRSLWIRTAENIDKIHESNVLQNEFMDLQSNGLANDFMIAERHYCNFIRELQEKLLMGAEIETEFLDQ